MAVWPFLMGAAVVGLALSLFARAKYEAWSFFVVFVGYVLIRSLVSGSESQFDINRISGAIWIMATILVLHGSTAKTLICKGLMFGAASCYVWAQVTGAKQVFGSLPYLISDALLIFAMIFIGWSMRHDLVSRINYMGVFDRSGDSGYIDSRILGSQSKEEAKR